MDSSAPNLRPPPPAVARLTRGLAIGAVAVISAGVTYYLSAAAAKVFTPQPVPVVLVNGLAIEQSALDLGEVWETTGYTIQIPVRNVSSHPRTVRGFRKGCACVEVKSPGFTLGPGEATTLTVTADLTRRDREHRGRDRWPVFFTLEPEFSDPAPPASWTLTGTALGRLSLDTPHLQFADDVASGGPPRSRAVRATAHVPLARVEAVPDSPAVAARVEEDGPGRFRVVVSPRPDLPVGPFRSTVAVRAVTPDGAAHPAAPVEVSGAVGSPVRVFPRITHLGEVSVPGEAAAEVTVRLPGEGWEVGRVDAGTEGVEARPVGPGPDGGTVYRITQPVAVAGDGRAEVWFVVRTPAGAWHTVPAEVRWFGRAAGRKGGRP